MPAFLASVPCQFDEHIKCLELSRPVVPGWRRPPDLAVTKKSCLKFGAIFPHYCRHKTVSLDRISLTAQSLANMC